MNRQQRRAAAKAANPGAAVFAEALRHYEAGRLREANALCQQLLARDRNDVAALHLTGLVALRVGLDGVALDTLSRALRLNPRVADLHAALAEALQRHGRLDEALRHNEQAIALDPLSPDALYNAGNILLRLDRPQEAAARYEQALALRPELVEARHNRGNAWARLGRFADALADYDRALAARPDFVQALVNRAIALGELQRHEEAVAACDRALSLAPGNLAALAQRGTALYELRLFARAARDFEELVAADPEYPDAAGKLLFCRLLLCDWSTYEPAVRAVVDGIAADRRAALPFMLLNIADEPEAQLRCARRFVADRLPTAAEPLPRDGRYGHERIRLAYLSADFRHHPMAYLMAGVFEAHDRTGFETVALSFGANPGDAFRRRLEASFERFLDVEGRSDREIAALLTELEIDIAVDLMGHSNGGRPGILARRGAPLQVNFLGYAGTMGADWIDYIIADRFVIPEDRLAFYHEQVVSLPDTYLPTDNRLPIAAAPPSRAELGLPDDAFVFCCFNNSYKIAPSLFEIWMRLLHAVPGSVLWLVRDGVSAVGNLREEAERRGVDPARLVFAPRVAVSDYLARLSLADLFLDTLPYNAHTTASDALWAGLPVLSCAGAGFAARVAGSVLHAAGLPELVTHTLADYEALALDLARDRGKLAAIRAKLAENRPTSALFDTARYCRHLEAAYRTMWQRHQAGDPPAAFAVPAIGGG